MDIEKLIEQLNGYFEGKTLTRGAALDAATAISTLQAENERLRKELEYEREHANAYYEECGQWEAENEKLRETVDKYATAARVIALHLKPFCDESLPYDEMIADAARKASDELEQVKRERDAAVEQLHGICSACKNYSPYHNRGKCRFCTYEPARDKDAEVNDNWEYRGQKEE